MDKRCVVLFKEDFHKLEQKLKRWEVKLKSKMPLKIGEVVDFMEYLD